MGGHGAKRVHLTNSLAIPSPSAHVLPVWRSLEKSTHLRLLLQARDDTLNGLLEILAHDRILAHARSYQRRLVAHVGNVGPWYREA